MHFKIVLTDTARAQLKALEHDPDKKDLAQLKKVRKCLAYLQTDPRHPSLATHEFHSMRGEHGQKVWEAYVENKTSAAWRVFWHYGPNRDEITVLAITPRP